VVAKTTTVKTTDIRSVVLEGGVMTAMDIAGVGVEVGIVVESKALQKRKVLLMINW